MSKRKGLEAHFRKLGATDKTAEDLASRAPYRIEGRSLLDCHGNELAYITREESKRAGDLPSPHGFDVLCKFLQVALGAYHHNDYPVCNCGESGPVQCYVHGPRE